MDEWTLGGNSIDYDTEAEFKALFVDYDNEDFTLASDSDAIDLADPAYASTIDMLGTIRDVNPDSGSYEFYPMVRKTEAVAVAETISMAVN